MINYQLSIVNCQLSNIDCQLFILSGNVSHRFFNNLRSLVGELSAAEDIKNVGMGIAHLFEEGVLTLAYLVNRHLVHQSVHSTVENGNLFAYRHRAVLRLNK